MRFNYNLLREKSSCTVFCKFKSGRNTFLPLIVLLVTMIRTQCIYVNCNHKCFLMNNDNLLHDNFHIISQYTIYLICSTSIIITLWYRNFDLYKGAKNVNKSFYVLDSIIYDYNVQQFAPKDRVCFNKCS